MSKNPLPVSSLLEAFRNPASVRVGLYNYALPVLDARATMPLVEGHIGDPRYLPPAKQAAALKAWGAWFRANPLYREPWMLELIAWGKRAQSR